MMVAHDLFAFLLSPSRAGSLERDGLGALPGFLRCFPGIGVHLTVGQCVFFWWGEFADKFLVDIVCDGTGWGQCKGRSAEKPLALGRACLKEPL